MPRVGANRPLNERVIFELGSDYQLADEDALGGGGGGATLDARRSVMQSNATVLPSGAAVLLNWNTPDAAPDDLDLTPQIPTEQFTLAEAGLYEVTLNGNFKDAVLVGGNTDSSGTFRLMDLYVYCDPADRWIDETRFWDPALLVLQGTTWGSPVTTVILLVPEGSTARIAVSAQHDSDADPGGASDLRSFEAVLYITKLL